MPEIVYIALGSNIGNKRYNILRAIKTIDNLPDTKVEKSSKLYKTIPEGNPNQPNFINAVIKIQTSFSAAELLKQLLIIEKRMGRKRPDKKCQPRPIDIDILLYNQLIFRTHRLTIPHPRMHIRNFVLEPLCEIAPNLLHPLLHKSVKELWAAYNMH